MLKALSKLTKSKSVPPSDDQIRRHKEQKRQRDQWQSDVDAVKSIIDRLRTQYGQHKGDFALGRYEELKGMIKSAVKGLEEVTKENKAHRTQSYTQGSNSRNASRTTSSAGGSTSGRLNSLVNNAAMFAQQQEAVCSEERKYSESNSKEIDAELESLRKEIIHLKEDYRRLRDRLEHLGKLYEESKQLSPIQRYPALKEMIKNTVTEDVS